ncbi:MAG: substrate-binding domain-containing protein [Capsulimonadaceae bacterium]|nr:substrate-binding domain-containing protein [Capsulimonadaceae bacterium]
MPRSKSTTDPLPVYKRIENDIRVKIRRGTWSAGALLPSRNTLASDYNVSVGTVERAISKLLAEGTLQATDRSGTFVSLSANLETSSSAGQAAPKPRKEVLGIAIAFQEATFGVSDSLFLWSRTITTSLERTFVARGGGVRVCNAYHPEGLSRNALRETIDQLIAEGATAIVVENIHDGFGERSISDLDALVKDGSVPIVCTVPREFHGSVPQVYCNLAQTGFLAVEHLMSLGEQHVTVIAPDNRDWIEERIAGARRAIQYLELPHSALDVVNAGAHLTLQGAVGAHFTDIAYDLTKQMIADGRLTNGIFAVNDAVAYGVLKAAKEAGLQAGRDFSLVGVDDAPLSQVHGLTSFRPPMEDVAAETMHLLERVKQNAKSDLRVNLRPQLLVRASSRRLDSKE